MSNPLKGKSINSWSSIVTVKVKNNLSELINLKKIIL